MRPRISRGTLVGSTNPHRHTLSKRLIVEVIYTYKSGVIRQKTKDVRQTLNQ